MDLDLIHIHEYDIRNFEKLLSRFSSHKCSLHGRAVEFMGMEM